MFLVQVKEAVGRYAASSPWEPVETIFLAEIEKECLLKLFLKGRKKMSVFVPSIHFDEWKAMQFPPQEEEFLREASKPFRIEEMSLESLLIQGLLSLEYLKRNLPGGWNDPR